VLIKIIFGAGNKLAPILQHLSAESILKKARHMPSLDSYFGFNSAAAEVKSRRLEIISGNITNASTPGYKAKDLDFAKVLKQYSSASSNTATMRATQAKHIGAAGALRQNMDSAITYYTPLNPSLDNNTVEMGVEQARFGRAVADYQASIQFLENKISGMRKALRGE
jgi:flagellar basal-body rod protein FlgB